LTLDLKNVINRCDLKHIIKLEGIMLTNFSHDHSRIVPKHDIDFFNLEEKYFSMKKENEKFFFPWAIENTESYTKSASDEIKNLENEEIDLKKKLDLIQKKISALKNSIADYR
jgi:predicted nuclease with TOPRIM domain